MTDVRDTFLKFVCLAALALNIGCKGDGAGLGKVDTGAGDDGSAYEDAPNRPDARPGTGGTAGSGGTGGTGGGTTDAAMSDANRTDGGGGAGGARTDASVSDASSGDAISVCPSTNTNCAPSGSAPSCVNLATDVN